MMKPKRTRRSVSIDEKIQSVREVIARTKARYDKEVSFLKFLLNKRNEIRKNELMKAIEKSDRTYEEILRFIRS